MEDVQQLALVFVDALHLHVEDGVRIHLDAVVLENVLRQALRVLKLDVPELLQGLLIVRVDLQLRQLRKIRDPAVADAVGDPGGETRVAVQQEAPLRDAVRLVVELLRHHFVEVLQRLLLQDLRGSSSSNSSIGHFSSASAMIVWFV